MSKIVEYLKLLPKGVINGEKILEGWQNEIKLQFGTLQEDEREEILRRRVICSACPLNSINAQVLPEYKELFGIQYKTKRDDLHCSICACPIQSKTASLTSECGLTDYNIKNSDNVQELKWTKYTK